MSFLHHVSSCFVIGCLWHPELARTMVAVPSIGKILQASTRPGLGGVAGASFDGFELEPGMLGQHTGFAVRVPDSECI